MMNRFDMDRPQLVREKLDIILFDKYDKAASSMSDLTDPMIYKLMQFEDKRKHEK